MAKVSESSQLDDIQEEWKDVSYTKLSNEGAIAIDNPEQFRVLCGIMYAAMQREEVSQRALDLTDRVISHSPACYTAYEYRRTVLRGLGKDATTQELPWAENCCLQSPKNYQTWQHRRWVVEQAGDVRSETALVEAVLAADPKNYHAWSYRIWAVRHFYERGEYDGKDEELDFSEKLIDFDPRNNSAWNYRYFIWKLFSEVDVGKEVSFALEQMHRAPRNESLWTYIRAVLRLDNECAKARLQVSTAAENVLHANADNVPARVTLLHLLQDLTESGEQRVKAAALSHIKVLQEGDCIRQRYWKWCADHFAAL